MSKKIVITESQFTKLFNLLNEQESLNPLFQSDYNADTKSITVAYYVLEEKPNSYKIINPIEIEDKSSIYADSFIPYTLRLKVTDLPKSQVKVIGEQDGYTVFEVPYWLYRKNEDLKVKRLDTTQKRPDARTTRTNLTSLFDFETLMKILEPLGGDLKKIKFQYSNLETKKDI
jgi:hypothetical protein